MNKDSKEYYLNILDNLTYGFNYRYGITFLRPEVYNRVSDALSGLRRLKVFTGEEIYFMRNFYKMHRDNYFKVKELIYQEPRIEAQRFIGKKNIREFIFKRDGYKCLKCGSNHRLQIDHIHAIHNGGENKLSNLQTLCGSCNSKKSTNYKDYR